VLAKHEEKMIGRFITLLDYVCMESLFATMVESLKQLTTVFKKISTSKVFSFF
jgi:hypothetical protein